MSIQEFALQLEQTDEPLPLLQVLQALRKCKPDQLLAELDEAGWIQWPDGATE